MLQKNPQLTAAQVEDILRRTARRVGEGEQQPGWGAGKVDALAAWNEVPQPNAGARAKVASPGADAAPALARTERPREATSALHPVLRALRARADQHPEGALVASLISRHFSEVRRLVNTNRRIATMWHRADGPMMLRRLAIGANERAAAPPLLDEDDRAYMSKMIEQLRRYGSPRLQDSIDRHQRLVLRMLSAPLAAQLPEPLQA